MATAASKVRSLPLETTRDVILRVATQLFARMGYDRVTMRDISAGAGFTLPTIYHHFKDKENLYREVELANYGVVHERLLKALGKTGAPKARLRSFIGEMFDILNDDVVFRSLALRNMLDPDGHHHAFLVGETLQDVYELIEKLVMQHGGVAMNKIVPLALISSVLGFIAMEPAKRQIRGYAYGADDRREERERFIDYLLSSALPRG
jgi:TetR/AcrR family transcriptional regulator